ncbi:Imm7 family immunity protein [Kitasatospora sp. NPDC056531]|uniref:Imm7 family immunity protein n=1 Tax=Kitasatospora sp. NPDC056531 TaxID=3345856 RepID=UPI0036BAF099
MRGNRRRIDGIASPGLVDLRWMNGALFLHFGGRRNHRDTEVLDFFREVGRRAPGSYGLLHVRNDEDLVHENEARVLRTARGDKDG